MRFLLVETTDGRHMVAPPMSHARLVRKLARRGRALRAMHVLHSDALHHFRGGGGKGPGCSPGGCTLQHLLQYLAEKKEAGGDSVEAYRNMVVILSDASADYDQKVHALKTLVNADDATLAQLQLSDRAARDIKRLQSADDVVKVWRLLNHFDRATSSELPPQQQQPIVGTLEQLEAYVSALDSARIYVATTQRAVDSAINLDTLHPETAETKLTRAQDQLGNLADLNVLDPSTSDLCSDGAGLKTTLGKLKVIADTEEAGASSATITSETVTTTSRHLQQQSLPEMQKLIDGFCSNTALEASMKGASLLLRLQSSYRNLQVTEDRWSALIAKVQATPPSKVRTYITNYMAMRDQLGTLHNIITLLNKNPGLSRDGGTVDASDYRAAEDYISRHRTTFQAELSDQVVDYDELMTLYGDHAAAFQLLDDPAFKPAFMEHKEDVHDMREKLLGAVRVYVRLTDIPDIDCNLKKKATMCGDAHSTMVDKNFLSIAPSAELLMMLQDTYIAPDVDKKWLRTYVDPETKRFTEVIQLSGVKGIIPTFIKDNTAVYQQYFQSLIKRTIQKEQEEAKKVKPAINLLTFGAGYSGSGKTFLYEGTSMTDSCDVNPTGIQGLVQLGVMDLVEKGAELEILSVELTGYMKNVDDNNPTFASAIYAYTDTEGTTKVEGKVIPPTSISTKYKASLQKMKEWFDASNQIVPENKVNDYDPGVSFEFQNNNSDNITSTTGSNMMLFMCMIDSPKEMMELLASSGVAKAKVLNTKGDGKPAHAVASAMSEHLCKVKTARILKNRVMATPNNTESSRGHLAHVLTIREGGRTRYWTIFDMAGLEGPQTIWGDFFSLQAHPNSVGTIRTSEVVHRWKPEDVWMNSDIAFENLNWGTYNDTPENLQTNYGVYMTQKAESSQQTKAMDITMDILNMMIMPQMWFPRTDAIVNLHTAYDQNQEFSMLAKPINTGFRTGDEEARLPQCAYFCTNLLGGAPKWTGKSPMRTSVLGKMKLEEDDIQENYADPEGIRILKDLGNFFKASTNVSTHRHFEIDATSVKKYEYKGTAPRNFEGSTYLTDSAFKLFRYILGIVHRAMVIIKQGWFINETISQLQFFLRYKRHQETTQTASSADTETKIVMLAATRTDTLRPLVVGSTCSTPSTKYVIVKRYHTTQDISDAGTDIYVKNVGEELVNIQQAAEGDVADDQVTWTSAGDDTYTYDPESGTITNAKGERLILDGESNKVTFTSEESTPLTSWVMRKMNAMEQLVLKTTTRSITDKVQQPPPWPSTVAFTWETTPQEAEPTPVSKHEKIEYKTYTYHNFLIRGNVSSLRVNTSIHGLISKSNGKNYRLKVIGLSSDEPSVDQSFTDRDLMSTSSGKLMQTSLQKWRDLYALILAKSEQSEGIAKTIFEALVSVVTAQGSHPIPAAEDKIGFISEGAAATSGTMANFTWTTSRTATDLTIEITIKAGSELKTHLAALQAWKTQLRATTLHPQKITMDRLHGMLKTLELATKLTID